MCIELLKNTVIVAINDRSSETLRQILGIESINEPIKLYKKYVFNELLKKGHSKELCEKALEKEGNTSIASCDTWIKNNIDWLKQTIISEKDKKKKLNKIKKSNNDEIIEMKELLLSDILDDNKIKENKWNLSESWKVFDYEELSKLNIGASGGVSNVTNEQWGWGASFNSQTNNDFHLILNDSTSDDTVQMKKYNI